MACQKCEEDIENKIRFHLSRYRPASQVDILNDLRRLPLNCRSKIHYYLAEDVHEIIRKYEEGK